MIHSCVFISLVIDVHESLVCPEQFNCVCSSVLFFRKILQLTLILWFSSIVVYLNPFQRWLHDFEIHLFSPRTTEGLIWRHYRRLKHSLMLQKDKPCIKSRGVNTFECEDQGKFYLICLLSIFCSFWRAVLNEKNMIFRKNTLNLWELKDFSEQFNCSGQTRDSRTTKHKHKNTHSCGSFREQHSIKNQAHGNF